MDMESNQSAINIIFDGPPGPQGGRFIEIEDDSGGSIKVGEWIERGGGFWVLRIMELPGVGNVGQRGDEGVRDPNDFCRDFITEEQNVKKSRPQYHCRDCTGDGHYLCAECLYWKERTT